MHCKAGRGRSTTLVLCYLIRQMRMSPEEAYAFVQAKRPQVCLAEGQWAAVREVTHCTIQPYKPLLLLHGAQHLFLSCQHAVSSPGQWKTVCSEGALTRAWALTLSHKSTAHCCRICILTEPARAVS